MTNTLGILICALAPLIAVQPLHAQDDQGGMESLEESDAEMPSPLGDPYEPEPGDPTHSRPMMFPAKSHAHSIRPAIDA